MPEDRIRAAFEELSANLDKLVEELNQSGASSLRVGDLERTESLIDKSKRLASIKVEVNSLFKEFNQIYIKRRFNSQVQL